MADIKSESIALAALFQCCTQIQRIASTGYADDFAVACVFRALLVTNPKTVEDIYDPNLLKVGFRQMVDSFSKVQQSASTNTIELTKTALKLISLEHSVENNTVIFDRLSDQIDALKESITTEHPDFFDGQPEVVNTSSNIHLFGTLYQSLISPNFSKLLIYGDERYLRLVENQEKIRALLLAGIRAVVLWRQVGGKRRYLYFRRNAILDYARKQI